MKGLAEFRLGHYADAAEWLGKITLRVGVPARDVEVQATLAMAQWVVLPIIILIVVAILLVVHYGIPIGYGFSGTSRIATTLARE